MSERKGFDLGDYVEVKDRITRLYEFFPQARIETTYELTSAPDDKPKVVCRALVYRKPEDEKPAGHGTSWMYLPGSTPYTKGSEIENAETSAVGRAIGMLGILIDRSIASANEVRDKGGAAREEERAREASRQPQESPDPAVNQGEQEEMIGRVTRQGIVRKGTAEKYKLEPREGPDGHAFGFRLEIDSDKAIPQCVVDGPLGEALYLFTNRDPAVLLGKRAKVSGLLYNVTLKGKQSWYRLHVDRFENDDVILPAEAPDAAAA